MTSNSREDIHNKHAPFWAIALVLIGGIGISTTWINLGAFWKGYVLDITGPAWNYILFRGLFTTYAENRWTRFFTPPRTYIIFMVVCMAIETIQFLGLYDATFDLWDLLAYSSLITPAFIFDRFQSKKAMVNSDF